jgi:anti-anti-sigma regulatory factor
MKNKTFSIKTSANKNAGTQTVVIEGDLGINNAEAIKKAVSAIKFNAENITLELRNIEKFDITSIQLFRAFKNNFTGKGEKINVISEFPQEIERLLVNTGFETFINKQ